LSCRLDEPRSEKEESTAKTFLREKKRGRSNESLLKGEKVSPQRRIRENAADIPWTIKKKDGGWRLSRKERHLGA